MQIPKIEGAIVVMDPIQAVLAVVGGFSYAASQFDRAVQAKRQPGSSFKPIVYAAALDDGYTPASIALDEPLAIEQGKNNELWKPKDYSGKFHGPSTLRLGVEQSRNLRPGRSQARRRLGRVCGRELDPSRPIPARGSHRRSFSALSGWDHQEMTHAGIPCPAWPSSSDKSQSRKPDKRNAPRCCRDRPGGHRTTARRAMLIRCDCFFQCTREPVCIRVELHGVDSGGHGPVRGSLSPVTASGYRRRRS
jgi:hypothetical protein